jgi:hypothetical protein
MNETWTARKLKWLEALAKDDLMRGLPLAIGVLLAIRYLNGKTENAWPAIGTLAEELDTDRRAVQRAINRLVASGWLRRTVRGGRDTNRYMLPIELPAQFRDRRRGGAETAPRSAQGRSRDRCRGGLDGRLGAVPRPPDLKKNPRGNPRGSFAASAARAPGPRNCSFSRQEDAGGSLKQDRTEGGPSLPKKQRRRPLPEGWVLGDNEMAAAQQVVDWDGERMGKEFDAFLSWHREKAPYSYDWEAAWINWCRKGVTFEHKSSKSTLRTDRGFGSILAGINDCLEEKKQTKH